MMTTGKGKLSCRKRVKIHYIPVLWLFLLFVSLQAGACAPVIRKIESSLGLQPEKGLRKALTRTPVEWKDAMTRAEIVDSKVMEGHQLNKNPVLNKRLQRMVDRLREVSHAPEIPFQVKIIDSEQINAFNTGGELLYVFTGLIDYVGSDDELAGILAHEMAHGIGAHIQREQRSMFLPSLGSVLASVALQDQTADQIISLVNKAVSSGYSRRHEREADILAVVYTNRAGYNPLGLEDFFYRINREAHQVKKEKEKRLQKTYSQYQKAISELKQQQQVYESSYLYLQKHPSSPPAQRRLQQAQENLENTQEHIDQKYMMYQQAYRNYAQVVLQMFPIFQSHPPDPERVDIINSTYKYIQGQLPLNKTPSSVEYVMKVLEKIKPEQ